MPVERQNIQKASALALDRIGEGCLTLTTADAYARTWECIGVDVEWLN